MKIFFVSRGWPSEQEPQWGCFERDQALALRKMGHQVVVLSVDVRFRTKYKRHYGIKKSLHGDITCYNLYAGPFWGVALQRLSLSLYKRVNGYLFMHLYENVVKQLGTPDIIYAHYLKNSERALFAKQKNDIPVVGMEHWSYLGYEQIDDLLIKRAYATYRKLDLLLTVSSALQENILRQIGIESIVVNNMLGHEFCYMPTERNEKIVRFVTTGNLLPVKGFDNLINAFSKLNLPPDSWTLNIIGGGKEHDNLQKLIDSVGLSNNIHLLGRKNREGVIEMLHNSDVYVMSSRSETFGVAAIEALACGLPLIATDCGGARDFVTKENGVICPVENVEKLAECNIFMMNHYLEYDRTKIAEDCQKRFSSEAIGKQLEGIFEEVLRKNKKQ